MSITNYYGIMSVLSKEYPLLIAVTSFSNSILSHLTFASSLAALP